MQTNNLHIKNTFYYTLAPVIRNFFLFITLPILTRYLSPSDYGMVNLITMVASFSSLFFMGVQNSTVRYFFKYKKDPLSLQSMFSTNILFVVLASVLYFIILITGYPYINHYILNDKIPFIWLSIGFWQAALMYINTMNQYFLQNSFEGKRWFQNELVAIFIQVGLSICLVVFGDFKYEAIILAGFCSELGRFIMSYYKLAKYYSLSIKFPFLKESLKYSWPQVPTNLVSFSYSYLDKFLLNRYQNVSQVGFADLSSKISNILKMITDGVSGTLSPLTLDLLHEGSEASLKKLADINLKVIFLLFGFALGLILFAQELIIILTTKEYHSLIYIAPIYIYYHIFGILGMVSYWLIYIHPDKTYLQIPLNLINLIISTIINIILIPIYGIWGAAIALVISSAICQIIQFIVAYRITPIPIKIGKMILLFGVILFETGMLYLLYWIKPFWAVSFIIRLIMLSGFFFLGMSINIVKISEVKTIMNLVINKAKSKFGLSIG